MQGLKEKFCNIYITPVDDIIVARSFCDDNFMFETKKKKKKRLYGNISLNTNLLEKCFCCLICLIFLQCLSLCGILFF